MQLARLFSRMGGRTREDKISGPFNWDELERLTARLGVLHGRLETAQAVGHHGTVNTVKRDMRQVWTERDTVTGAGGPAQINYHRYPDGAVAHLQYPGGVWVRHRSIA